jgi:hypothetical protein
VLSKGFLGVLHTIAVLTLLMVLVLPSPVAAQVKAITFISDLDMLNAFFV